MNSDIKTIENKIKQIIEKNEDAVKGFQKAAENVKREGVISYFQNRAKQRELFVKTLHNATPVLETGDAEISGSTKGTMHRTWMDIKTFFTSNDDEAMLKEAVRGDESAISEYNEILTETMLPHRMKEIIREQRNEIQNDLETSGILERLV
ncbi:ferritin-like domain-containing protein [Costertonia aggregata]|uniref:PA2169 family four-helix-bundle protein n=1 Tax=Costertonia aggregata TaxID=343403 RepID=A0A7H9APU9_9FLAO|nr:PA2169 family four-helix-bundle protein [Costertonia aggregata]QLG45456.1 PA2169 family four-helix-bundle protein [Costertonia aggregata]